MSKSQQPFTCSSCGAELARPTRFCPDCGRRLLAGDTLVLPPEAPLRFPRSVHQRSRGSAGLAPAAPLGALGALALLVAIVLFATGAWIAGMISSGLALALLTLFLSAVRRERDSQLAQLTLAAVGRARSLARLTLVGARAWARAALELVRIRRRQRRLRHELRDRLAPLGEAVCHDDRQRAEALKAQASERERALRETELQASAAVGGARRQVERERATSQPTQPLPAAQADALMREDAGSGKPSREGRAPHWRA